MIWPGMGGQRVSLFLFFIATVWILDIRSTLKSVDLQRKGHLHTSDLHPLEITTLKMTESGMKAKGFKPLVGRKNHESFCVVW